MKFEKLRKDRGTAGLTILLSVVTMLFVIGLLIMIFVLMGGEMMDSDIVKSGQTSPSTSQDGLNISETAVSLTVCAGANQGSATLSTLVNGNNATETMDSTNVTVSLCDVTWAGAGVFNSSVINVTYTYTYAGNSYGVMNDTISGISTTTDWFPLFIVITAMVVLILLTVIIITAIRSSGLMGETA